MEVEQEERTYYLSFSLSPGIGPKRFQMLLSHFGKAKDAWQASEEEYQVLGIKNKVFEGFYTFRKTFNVESYLKKLKEKNVSFVTLLDKEYPEHLKKIEDPPPVLFLKGDLSSIDWSHALAVVGTRKMTQYGKEVTEKLVPELVVHGFVIISGLALGVDVVAHKTSIDNDGKTVAVLGCGVDCCYPRENENVYRKIVEGCGIVVSSFPLSMQPSRGMFPARNKIISGLSIGVLVTEAGEDSGALITAEYAKKQDRPVFAVPGPITSTQSAGTAKLLKNGAIFIQSVDDILNYFSIDKKRKISNTSHMNLSGDEKLIYDSLLNEPLHINILAKKTGINISELSTLVTMLELKGIVRNMGGGEFGLQ